MVSNRKIKGYTSHQKGALLGLLVLFVWCLFVFWFHLTTPAGADMFEMTYVGALAIIFLLLLPLYLRRIHWAYLGGILAVFAMLAGAIKATLDKSFIFSWSFYNLTVFLVYVVALAVIYFSFFSYRELVAIGGKRTFPDIIFFILLVVLIATVLWFNQDLIQRSMWQLTLNRIDSKLQDLETLDEKIRLLVNEGDLNSLTAGIVVKDSLVWGRAYGEAELNSIYNIGSITKPFVATAIMQLYERDLIDLEVDASQYLPFILRHPLYPEQPITIRMLLTHQSGLAHFTDSYMSYHMDKKTADWLVNKQGWHLPEYDTYPSFAEFIKDYLIPEGAYYTTGCWTEDKPGVFYSYSTVGYDILAYLVECVTGETFIEYAQSNIFDPLEMQRTGFDVNKFKGEMALPFERVYNVLNKTNVELPIANVRTIGGGGMLSTVPDLAQFMIAHMNHGQVDDYLLLKPETVLIMHKTAVTFPPGRGDLNQVSCGLGIGHIRKEPWNCWGHLYDMHGAKGHGGSWFGYLSQMWFVEEEQNTYGVILLTNTEFDFKAEARDLWNFSSPLKLLVLLMEEAQNMAKQKTNT